MFRACCQCAWLNDAPLDHRRAQVWDRTTGALVADLAGGHTGRIFCIGFDCTKVVSCGEDQVSMDTPLKPPTYNRIFKKICIWDLAYGLDTSFLKL